METMEQTIRRVLDEIVHANRDKFNQARTRPLLRGWFVGQVIVRIHVPVERKEVKKIVDETFSGAAS